MIRLAPLRRVAIRRPVVLGSVVVAGVLFVFLASALRPKVPSLPDLDASGEGTLFGAHVRPDDRSQKGEKLAIETLESTLGRRLDIDHSFYPWEKEFPLSMGEGIPDMAGTLGPPQRPPPHDLLERARGPRRRHRCRPLRPHDR
jgi:hypothetical protein